MDVLNRFAKFINKDVSDENETKTAAVVMRLFVMFAELYSIIQLVLFLAGHYFILTAVDILFILLYGLCFYLTYKNRTKLTRRLLSILVVVWVCVFSISLGWDSGIQLFLFALLILFCMTSYAPVQGKLLYTAFFIAIMLALFFYHEYFYPIYFIGRIPRIIYLVAGITVVFTLAAVLMIYFSYDKMNMEQKLIRYNEKIKKMASADPLTGLPNRRYITERIERLVASSERNQGFINLAIGDIDFFKKVNDTYGHKAGDDLLKQLSSIFMDYMENRGDVARWGGEEFLFVFTGINGDSALEALEALRTDIKNKEFECDGNIIKITMTFGLEEWGRGEDIEATIVSADEKLYLGKKGGRDRVVF